SGPGARRQGRGGVRGSSAALGARQIPECRSQGVGLAARLERAVSLSETAPLSAPGVRRVWPKRMFWGTDLTGIPCIYRQAVTMFTEELPWLAGEDLEWVMGHGICEWLGWPLPG